jgi:hypothetical protein
LKARFFEDTGLPTWAHYYRFKGRNRIEIKRGGDSEDVELTGRGITYDNQEGRQIKAAIATNFAEDFIVVKSDGNGDGYIDAKTLTGDDDSSYHPPHSWHFIQAYHAEPAQPVRNNNKRRAYDRLTDFGDIN